MLAFVATWLVGFSSCCRLASSLVPDAEVKVLDSDIDCVCMYSVTFKAVLAFVATWVVGFSSCCRLASSLVPDAEMKVLDSDIDCVCMYSVTFTLRLMTFVLWTEDCLVQKRTPLKGGFDCLFGGINR